MSIDKFLKNPNTVKTILSSLGLETTLPNEGFIAGGSVANMLLSLYHSGTPRKFKINDIDIFKSIDPINPDEVIESEGEELLKDGISLGVDITLDEGYGHVYVERDGTYYKVVKAERNGIINDITCLVSHGKSGRDVTLNSDPSNDIILRGFDLNCCQAGIDLKNGQLHYTEPFKNFLKSKQVLVDIPHTPFHTAIRLVKKMKMYGDYCYCDIPYEMWYLYQATFSDESCVYFGVENYDKFMDNEDVLKRYLEIKPIEIEDMPYDYRMKYFPKSFVENTYHNRSNRNPYVETEMVVGRELWSYDFKNESEMDINDIPETFNRLWELKKIWDFRYRNHKKSHRTKIEMIMNFSNNSGGRMMDFSSLLSNEGSSSLSYPLQCLMSNDYYYDCDFTKEHLSEISEFISEHRLLAGLLSKVNNVQEQYNHVKMLKTLTKQEGGWIIGTLETLGVSEMVKGVVITKEWIEGLIVKEKLRMEIPLVKPLNLDNFKYKDSITELTTPLNLQEEGKKMGHCVGGYSYNLEQGTSRMFHIVSDGMESTLEIGLVDHINVQWELDTKGNRCKGIKRFSVKQHQGRFPEKMGNQTPTNKCRGIGMKLVYYLSKQGLSKSEFNDMFRDTEYPTHNPIDYSIMDKKIIRNVWNESLNDRHRGKNSLNKLKKRTSVFDF